MQLLQQNFPFQNARKFNQSYSDNVKTTTDVGWMKDFLRAFGYSKSDNIGTGYSKKTLVYSEAPNGPWARLRARSQSNLDSLSERSFICGESNSDSFQDRIRKWNCSSICINENLPQLLRHNWSHKFQKKMFWSVLFFFYLKKIGFAAKSLYLMKLNS